MKVKKSLLATMLIGGSIAIALVTCSPAYAKSSSSSASRSFSSSSSYKSYSKPKTKSSSSGARLAALLTTNLEYDYYDKRDCKYLAAKRKWRCIDRD